MKPILQIFAIFQLTLKRLWAQLGMTLATTFGLTMAVALLMTVPLYADAVNFRILEDRLSALDNQRRPPWAFLYNYVGSWHGSIQWEDIQDVNSYLFDEADDVLNLPLELAIRHLETPNYQLFPTDSVEYNNLSALGFGGFATTTGIENNIQIIEGDFPVPSAGEPIEVLITLPFAEQVGWQVGEEYIALNHKVKDRQETFRIRVAGIWIPVDETAPFWFYSPAAFDELLIVHEDAFVNVISPAVQNEIDLALWYLVMDGRQVDTNNVESLVVRARRIEQRIDTLLPNTAEFISPTSQLQGYRQAVEELAILLFTFDVPPIWLVLSFIGLVVGLAVSQQKNEIAVLRSRGGTPSQVISMAVLEGLFLGAIAFVLGTFLAIGLTQLMARSRSFLDFSDTTVVRVALTEAGLIAGGVAIGLALIARIAPVIAASKHTIITFKQEQARSLVQPWWQRAWLDLLLVGIVGYGFYLLRQQGTIAVIAADESVANPFQNPLLILLPALAIFALTLFFLRILPWLMRGLGWLLTNSDSISLLQAVRYLARTPNHYRTPLGLLILTVSLALFTASLARTVDLQLYDENFYEIGAELNLATFPPPPPAFGASSEPQSTFTFLPASEYETIPGIERATRVGQYEMRSQVNGRAVRGTFIGVDHADFRDVAYWRWDFSRYRLGTLMNALGNHLEGILVPGSLIEGSTIAVGDTLRYSIILDGTAVEFDGVIVGTFDYFPTWTPSPNDILLVGNLNTVFEKAGGEFPYRVWAKTNGVLEERAFRQQLFDRQLANSTWRQPRPLVANAQAQPERQGLFGILSVGFIASALLTVIGFFLYTLFSFRRRSVEMGILRAVGLSRVEMSVMVAWELFLLIISGLLIGTLLGVGVSQQFIPFLQVSANIHEVAPPYLVEIAWDAIAQVYFLFGLLFVFALAALMWRLVNLKVFESIKMGETV